MMRVFLLIGGIIFSVITFVGMVLTLLGQITGAETNLFTVAPAVFAIAFIGEYQRRYRKENWREITVKKVFLGISVLMLFIAVCFVTYALGHPEASFPWSNTITYSIYSVYAGIMVACFVISRVVKK